MLNSPRILLACGLAVLGIAFAEDSAGVRFYQNGEYQKALEFFEREAASGNPSPETHFWLGYSYLAVSEPDRAILPFEQYLRAHPSDEDVLYALCRTYALLAERSLQQIFRLDPGSARSFQMRGIRFELESSWREAVEQYERALALDPAIPGLHAAIGRIQAKELHDPEAATRSYKRELERSPFSREANEFFAQTAEDGEARRIVTGCFEREGADCPMPAPEGARERGILLLEQQRPTDSLPHLLQWRQAEPSNTDVYFYLGEAFTDLKVRTIQRLKEASPKSYRLHQILAESYASTHRRSEAVTEYRRALELQPEVPGVNYELARLLADTETEAAIRHLERELALDPHHYMARGLLGRIYAALRQPEKAVPLLEQALAAQPGLLDNRKALGQAYAAGKDYEKALEQYDAVAQENPFEEQIHFLRAQAFQALGRSEEAAAARRRHQEVLREVTEKAQ